MMTNAINNNSTQHTNQTIVRVTLTHWGKTVMFEIIIITLLLYNMLRGY